MKTAPATPRRLRLPHRSPPIEVWVAGDGPPLALLHGWGLSGRAYRTTLAEIAATGRQVIAPTMTPGDRRFSMEAVADRVAGALEAFECLRIPVVGHSFGAAVAVRLACDRPELAGALVLVDPVGVSPGMLRLARIAVPGKHWRVAANPATAGALVRSVAVRGSLAGLRGSARWILTGRLEDELTMLRECAMPSVVLWAEGESVLPRSVGEREAELLGCRFKIVRATAGWPHRRRPDHDWPFRAPTFFARRLAAEVDELLPRS